MPVWSDIPAALQQAILDRYPNAGTEGIVIAVSADSAEVHIPPKLVKRVVKAHMSGAGGGSVVLDPEEFDGYALVTTNLGVGYDVAITAWVAEKAIEYSCTTVEWERRMKYAGMVIMGDAPMP